MEDFSYFPIQFPEVEEMYQRQVAAFWTKSDLVFSGSAQDVELLDDEHKNVLNLPLTLFAHFDGIVANRVDSFTNHPDISLIKEAPYCFRIQSLIETIHSEVYGIMIQHYVPDVKARDAMLSSIQTNEHVHGLAEWLIKEGNTDNLLKSLFVNILTEAVMFQGLFAVIFWFRKTYKGKFIGLTKGNELIARDEDMHATTALTLLNIIRKIYKKDETKKQYVEWMDDRREVCRVVEEMIEILDGLFKHFIPQPVSDISSDKLMDYTKGWANIVLQSLDHNPLYDVTNSLDYMDNMTSMYRKTNFFEGKEVGYQKGLVHKPFVYDKSLLE